MLSSLIRIAEKRTTIRSLKLEVSLPCFEVLRISNRSFGIPPDLWKTKAAKTWLKFSKVWLAEFSGHDFSSGGEMFWSTFWYQNVWVSRLDFQSRTLAHSNSLLSVTQEEYHTSLTQTNGRYIKKMILHYSNAFSMIKKFTSLIKLPNVRNLLISVLLVVWVSSKA